MIKGLRHPFFNPLWRRVAMFVFLCLWTGFEFYIGSDTWGVCIAALTAIVGWTFVTWTHVEDEE